MKFGDTLEGYVVFDVTLKDDSDTNAHVFLFDPATWNPYVVAIAAWTHEHGWGISEVLEASKHCDKMISLYKKRTSFPIGV